MNIAFLISYAALWILVLLDTIVVVVAVRQIGIMHLRLGGGGAMALPAGPPIGEPAPAFASRDTRGNLIESPWHSGRNSLLVFVSPGCGACPEVIPSIRAIRRADRRRTEILLVSNAPGESNEDYARKSLCPVIVDGEVVASYAMDATPYGIAIDHQGVVRAKGVVNQIEHLESLLDHLSDSSDSSIGQHMASHGIGVNEDEHILGRHDD